MAKKRDDSWRDLSPAKLKDFLLENIHYGDPLYTLEKRMEGEKRSDFILRIHKEKKFNTEKRMSTPGNPQKATPKEEDPKDSKTLKLSKEDEAKFQEMLKPVEKVA